MSLYFCCDIWLARTEFDKNNMKASVLPYIITWVPTGGVAVRRIFDGVAELKKSQTGFLNITRHQTSIQLSTLVEQEICIMYVHSTDVQQLFDAIMLVWSKTSEQFPAPYWMCVMKN